jgi:uncharacterized membrane protein
MQERSKARSLGWERHKESDINMKNILEHLRKYFFQGLLAVIPLMICAVAVYLLYVLIDKKVMRFLDNFIEIRQIPGMGILLLFVFLCLIGMIVSNFFGKQLFKFIENISVRIPMINTIYGLGKQLTISLDTKNHAFKKAVLVKFNGQELMMPGFVMGSMADKNTKEEMLFVYIPTVPTPMGGFLFTVKASQVVDPGWTVEECLKVIVSMGIIAPKEAGVIK